MSCVGLNSNSPGAGPGTIVERLIGVSLQTGVKLRLSLREHELQKCSLSMHHASCDVELHVFLTKIFNRIRNIFASTSKITSGVDESE